MRATHITNAPQMMDGRSDAASFISKNVDRGVIRNETDVNMANEGLPEVDEGNNSEFNELNEIGHSVGGSSFVQNPQLKYHMGIVYREEEKKTVTIIRTDQANTQQLNDSMRSSVNGYNLDDEHTGNGRYQVEEDMQDAAGNAWMRHA